MKNDISPGAIAERISKGIKKVKLEVEEFALQASLGKSEARDRFESLKKEFREHVSSWEQQFSKKFSADPQKADEFRQRLDEIRLQLALGFADARDLFREQRDKIFKSIHGLEQWLKESPESAERFSEFQTEIEKFRLKMEILELQFEMKTFNAKERFKEAMNKAGIEVEKLFMKADEKVKDAKNKSGDFNKEITASFEHLKKAIASLRDQD